MSNAGELSAGYLLQLQVPSTRPRGKNSTPSGQQGDQNCLQVHSTIPNEKVIERITRILLLVKKSGSIDLLDSHTQVLIPWRRGATPPP